MASLFDEGDFAFKKGSGYLERHKEYYEKNKETIKERRRNYYYVKKEALTKKVGRFEFAKISAIKNLAEIPDPFEPYGRVKIENLNDSDAIGKKHALKNMNSLFKILAAFSLCMCDFHNFGLIFAGQCTVCLKD